MKEKLVKLIDVKSIVSLVFTLVFAVLALTHTIAANDFINMFSIIIVFYFTREQNIEKKNNGGGGNAAN